MSPDNLSGTVAGRGRGFLSAETIAAQARAIAEAEGLEQVSMRALAERLECTPRALYRYVSGKEEILELIADGAFAELAEPRTDLPWDEALVEYFAAMRQLLVDSPAVALIIAELPVAGKNFQAHANQLVALLTGAGLEPLVAVEATIALAYYTLGASLPGTGDAVLGTYRRLRVTLPEDQLPAFQRRAPDFADRSAAEQYRSALRRLIHGYAVDADLTPPAGER